MIPEEAGRDTNASCLSTVHNMKGQIVPEHARQPGWRWSPLTIILTYVLISGAWILFSDRLLALLVTDPAAFARDQTIKGWFFVAVTAVLLYEMIKRYTQTLERVQARLRESEAWYRRLITTAEEGIGVLDAEHRFTFINERLAKMLGYRVEEMLGRPIDDFIDPAWSAEVARHQETRRQGTPEVYESRYRAKDGAELWVITAGTPIFDEHGGYAGSFAMITDITERHRLEAYQEEFTRKLIEAATEGKLLLRTREEIERIAGPPLASWEVATLDDIGAVRQAVAARAHAFGMEEDRVFDLTLCLSEAATNAYKHVGRGTVSLHRRDGALLVVVSDCGPGIPAIHLPELALQRGYTTAGSLGLGYKAMIAAADRIYLFTSPAGTTVAIEMAPHPPAPPAEHRSYLA